MKHEVKPEQVPDVVWSAFCEAVYKYGYGPHALAAALNAWPGMIYSAPAGGGVSQEPVRTAHISLPLDTQENENGK